MIISYILDPNIFNIENFNKNAGSIISLKEKIDEDGSVIIIDKEEKLKDLLIDNISNTINSEASPEIIQDTNELFEMFSDGYKFYKDNNILEKNNNIYEFAKKVKSMNKFFDILITSDNKFVNNYNFESDSFLQLYKNNYLKLLSKKIKEFRSTQLHKNGFKKVIENLSRVLWSTKKVYFYDYIIPNTLNYDPVEYKWKWNKEFYDKYKDGFNSVEKESRYQSLAFFKKCLEECNKNNNVEVNIITWVTGKNRKILAHYHKDPQRRDNQKNIRNWFFKKIKEILPQSSNKVKFNLIVKVLDKEIKQHTRVMETDNFKMTLGFGIDIFKFESEKDLKQFQLLGNTDYKNLEKWLTREKFQVFEDISDLETVKNSKNL